MKETIKKGIILGITFSITVLTFFAVYAAIDSIWTTPSTLEVSSGSILTSSSWNKLLSNFNYLNSKAVKQDTEVLTITGGNVGIGIANPDYALTIKGNIGIRGTTGWTSGLQMNADYGFLVSLPSSLGDKRFYFSPSGCINYYNGSSWFYTCITQAGFVN